MPVSRPNGSDIADVVLNSCMPDGAVNSVNRMLPVVYDENDSTRTSVLTTTGRQYMEEIGQLVRSVLDKYQSWYAGMDVGIKDKLFKSVQTTINIDQTMHAELDTVHNTRFHSLAQLAIYLNLINRLENDRDYGDAQNDLRALRGKLKMTICTFKQLVQPNISDVQLRHFILQDCNKPGFTLDGNIRASVKRSVVITAINVMAQTLSSIQSV